MTIGQSLEVSDRHGKALAAYLHLPSKSDDYAATSREAGPGLVVDFAADGRPIGIEIVSPSIVTLDAVNQVLASLNQQTIGEEELAPLLAG
ncbi:MAG: DUF2283 domain-containing protein [Phycisphaerae bacterium]